jgi:hypothetical protein
MVKKYFIQFAFHRISLPKFASVILKFLVVL